MLPEALRTLPEPFWTVPEVFWTLPEVYRIIPEVYEGRKNSSAMCLLSTFVQNGKFPSTLRVPGRDRIPAPRVKYLANVY